MESVQPWQAVGSASQMPQLAIGITSVCFNRTHGGYSCSSDSRRSSLTKSSPEVLTKLINIAYDCLTSSTSRRRSFMTTSTPRPIGLHEVVRSAAPQDFSAVPGFSLAFLGLRRFSRQFYSQQPGAALAT